MWRIGEIESVGGIIFLSLFVSEDVKNILRLKFEYNEKEGRF